MAENIFDQIAELKESMLSEALEDAQTLEQFRIRYLGSKNCIKPLFSRIKEVENERKKEFGLVLNDLKNAAEEKYALAKAGQEKAGEGKEFQGLDLSMPASPLAQGARHPVSLVMQQIIEIFHRIGFAVVENREIEDEWHNFTALNTPEDHPARDMTDTYYLKYDLRRMLRSQTSTVQVHVMEGQQPPIRIISPGRVYRNETISSRSHCQFHQVEGLYIAEGVSFADLKQTLLYFARALYGPEVKIRLRASYFPFTEPSAEMDVYWGLETEADHRITKGTGWLEVLGCGMVDPSVLESCGIDASKYSGFAFGMGIERQAMRVYGITDIRMFFENDVRFLQQFGGAL
jgi:phenylalanyl-tRNA synthetase alpha chain